MITEIIAIGMLREHSKIFFKSIAFGSFSNFATNVSCLLSQIHWSHSTFASKSGTLLVMVSLVAASKEPTPLTTMITQPNPVSLSTRLVASETLTTLRASNSVKQYAPVSD